MRWLFFFMVILAGCQTTPEPEPAEASEKVHGRGQVVWKRDTLADELVADLQVEVSKEGSVTLQVVKGPVAILAGGVSKKNWWVQMPMEGREYKGKGLPPPQLSWLHLARCFGGNQPLPGWNWSVSRDGSWKFTHRGTGESFEGFLE